MMKLNCQYWHGRLLIAAGGLLLVSCGGSGPDTSSTLLPNGSRPLSGQVDNASAQSSPAEIDTTELVAQIEGSAAPAGIDGELYAQLTAELIRVLEERGVEKLTASLPDPEKSKVTDLAVSGDTTLATFSWSYSNPADYDQNGEVNIADLTPVGVHFGKDSNSPDWATASIADGDGNGLVNLADITPIGQNYLNRINGFELQLGDSNDATEWTLAADVAVSEGTVSSGRRSFSYELAGASEGWYRAVPYENGNPRSLGEPGNVVQLIGSNPLPSEFSEPGGGPGRTNVVGYEGPASAPGSEDPFYFGLEFKQVMVGDDQNLYAVDSRDYALSMNPDGEILWEFAIDSGYVVARLSDNDQLHITTKANELIVVDNSGALLRTIDIGMSAYPSGMTAGGRYLIYSLADKFIVALEPDGSEAWRFTPEGRTTSLAVPAADGKICVPSILPDNGIDPAREPKIHALDEDGMQIWEHAADPASGTYPFFAYGPDSSLYFDVFGIIYKLDADGNLLWSNDDYPAISWSLDSLGRVAIGGGQQPTDSVWLLDKDGNELWGTPVGGDVHQISFGQNGRIFHTDAFAGLKSIANGTPGTDWQLPEFPGQNFSGSGDMSGNFYLNRTGRLYKISPEGVPIWDRGESVNLYQVPVLTADGGYIVNLSSSIQAFDYSGNRRWKHATESYMNGGVLLNYQTAGSPIIRSDGSVVFSQYRTYDDEEAETHSDGIVKALDAQGNEVWAFPVPDRELTQVAGAADGGVYVFAEDYLSRNGALWSISPGGAQNWTLDLPTDSYSSHALAVEHAEVGDRVFIAYSAESGAIVDCYSSTGELVWSYPHVPSDSENIETVCATGDGGCLAVYEGDLVRLDHEGNVDWNVPYPGGDSFADHWYWAAVLPGGDVIASYEWYLTRIDSDGNEVWTTTISQDESNKWFAQFIVDGAGRTYGPVSGMGLRCFNSDGSEAWARDVPDIRSSVSPVIAPDGSLMVLLFPQDEILRLY